MTDESQSPSQETKSPPTVVEVARASMAALSKHLSGAHTALSTLVVAAEMKDDLQISEWVPEFHMFMRHALHVAQDIAFHCVQGPKSSGEISAAALAAKKETPQ